MKNFKEGNCLKSCRFATLRSSVRISKCGLSSLYIWAPYTQSTKHRKWQNDSWIFGALCLWGHNFFQKVVENVWSTYWNKNWLITNSKKGDCLKFFRFTILPGSVKYSKIGSSSLHIRTSYTQCKKQIVTKGLANFRCPMFLKSQKSLKNRCKNSS